MKKLIVIIFFLTFFTLVVAVADPAKAGVTAGTPETWTGITSGNSDVAEGGNITNLDISAESQTSSWQGYYGETEGNITLNDATGDTIYSWTVTNNTGEVFASRSNGVTWATIAGQETCTIDESLTGVGDDRVNKTFTNVTVSGWTIAGTSITKACQIYTYVNNASQSTSFEEIILTDTSNYVYSTKIDSDTQGFDGATHDFQMLVPVNKTSINTYYFYIEFG